MAAYSVNKALVSRAMWTLEKEGEIVTRVLALVYFDKSAPTLFSSHIWPCQFLWNHLPDTICLCVFLDPGYWIVQRVRSHDWKNSLHLLLHLWSRFTFWKSSSVLQTLVLKFNNNKGSFSTFSCFIGFYDVYQINAIQCKWYGVLTESGDPHHHYYCGATVEPSLISNSFFFCINAPSFLLYQETTKKTPRAPHPHFALGQRCNRVLMLHYFKKFYMRQYLLNFVDISFHFCLELKLLTPIVPEWLNRY